MDISAFRQMVEKNPKGFLGRYGLGNKILQEGGSLEEAAEHLTVATQLDPTHVASHLALGRGARETGKEGGSETGLKGRDRCRCLRSIQRRRRLGAGTAATPANAWIIQGGGSMDLDVARQRIESAITQYGQHAAMAIELVINEVRSDMGRERRQRVDR
jgi:hypothetical protein